MALDPLPRCTEPECHQLAEVLTRCAAHAGLITMGAQTWFRHAILRRDPICRVCLAARSTEAAHITPIADGGAPTDLENGLGMCAVCHHRKARKDHDRREELRSRLAQGVRESPSVGAPHASTPTVSLCTPQGVSRQKVEGGK